MTRRPADRDRNRDRDRDRDRDHDGDRDAAVPTSEPGPMSAAAIEETILGLLAQRQPDATICPSEVARALGIDDRPWRELMPQVRQVAQGLAMQGRLRVTRGGVPVDATRGGGPIRLGRPPTKGGR